MTTQDQQKEYFDLIGFHKDKRAKIGFACETDKGSLFLRADEFVDAHIVGSMLKGGLYIQKRQPRQDASASSSS